jgi:hypothetical protein
MKTTPVAQLNALERINSLLEEAESYRDLFKYGTTADEIFLYIGDAKHELDLCFPYYSKKARKRK